MTRLYDERKIQLKVPSIYTLLCLNKQDIYSKTPIDHSKSNDKKVFHIKKIGSKLFPRRALFLFEFPVLVRHMVCIMLTQ